MQGKTCMKLLATVSAAAVSIVVATAALSQSAAPPPADPPATVSSNQAAPVPVTTSKRMACLGAAQALKGQDRQDQVQLCMAQARLDCLKQAIDQKITGPQRRDFMQSCVGL
jgi:hypothetical protein